MKEKICARQVTTSDPVASEPAFGSGEGEGLGRMQRKSAQEALGAAFVTLTLRRGIEITLFTMTILEKGWISSFNTRLLNSCLHFSDLREYCSFLEFLFFCVLVFSSLFSLHIACHCDVWFVHSPITPFVVVGMVV